MGVSAFDQNTSMQYLSVTFFFFQLHFEEAQWTSEVARSQRRPPWPAAIGAKI